MLTQGGAGDVEPVCQAARTLETAAWRRDGGAEEAGSSPLICHYSRFQSPTLGRQTSILASRRCGTLIPVAAKHLIDAASDLLTCSHFSD